MAKKTLDELNAQIAKLTEEAEALRAEELGSIVAEIKEKISVYGLTAEDLFKVARGRKVGSTGGTVPVKYRNGEATWTGRGKKPLWVREVEESGASIEDFRVTA